MSTTTDRPDPDPIDPDEARAMLAAGAAVLVDVRDADAFAQAHPGGARNVPIGQLRARAGELPADVTLITSCGGGTRGPKAAAVLAGLGREARPLRGGLRGWRSAGLPVDEREDAR